jgi:hypothetical protein
VKVSVRVIGAGFPRAEALVADIRGRAIARLEARIAARKQRARAEQALQTPLIDEDQSTDPTRPTR